MTTDDAAAGRFGRRDILRGLGAGLALPLLAGCGGGYEPLPPPSRPGSRLDQVMTRVDSYLHITNAHTGDQVAMRFLEDGRYNRRAIRQLNWIFRDWRQNESPEIDPRVFWGLAAISDAARYDGYSGEITLLSGFRTKKTNNALRSNGTGVASNSYHTRRRAADIRVDGVPMEVVADYAEWLQVGGVGRYAAGFTHIDTGPTRTWNG